MRDAKPKLSFLNTPFDQRELIRENPSPLSSEDDIRTVKPSESIPKCNTYLWKPHAKREGEVNDGLNLWPDAHCLQVRVLKSVLTIHLNFVQFTPLWKCTGTQTLQTNNGVECRVSALPYLVKDRGSKWKFGSVDISQLTNTETYCSMVIQGLPSPVLCLTPIHLINSHSLLDWVAAEDH